MLEQHTRELLSLFEGNKYIIAEANETCTLTEKNESGSVTLNCTVLEDSLILTSPEHNVLPYLDGNKKGARACADVFIYEKIKNSGKWVVHIIEFKKTINVSTIDKSKWQFIMGIYNARAVAGFLGIELEKIVLHSGFRNDAIINTKDIALSAMRAANANPDIVKMWKSGEWKLELDGGSVLLEHKKIQLDEQGGGSVVI